MSFCPPPKFSHWETLPALPHGRYIADSRQTGTCYVMARAYSLEQQNAGRAQAGLCHASSFNFPEQGLCIQQCFSAFQRPH